MIEDVESPSDEVAGKRRVLRARSLFGDLAARVADPVLARRMEADLNDAWLRVQFALVTGDPARVQAERQALGGLLKEARRRAGGKRRPLS